MFNGRKQALLAAALLGGSAITAYGETPAASEERIRQLEAKIASLEARQSADSKELATTIDTLLKDADRRSQLLATSGDFSAGYDQGFFIRAGDAWVLRPGVQFQFRNVTNFREDTSADGDNSVENGFEVRRLRFEFAGNAITKNLEYLFQWETARDGGGVSLLEGWAKYSFSDNWGMRVGQFKDLVTHEFVMSSKRQLLVDTSLVDNLLGGGVAGYTQGATVVYGGYNKNNPLNIEAGITDGANQINTNFVDKDYNFGVAGRAEYKFFGDWKSYRDFTAKDNKNDLLVVGVGGDWSQNGDGNQILGTADLQYETASGFGAYGALLLRNTDAALSTSGESTTDWGGLVQASYLLNRQWELFARYDVTFFDNETSLKRGGETSGAFEDTFHEITAGVNYYLGKDGSAGHRAKITFDLTYLPNGAPKSATGLGILDDNGGEAEWVFRGQFQLLL